MRAAATLLLLPLLTYGQSVGTEVKRLTVGVVHCGLPREVGSGIIVARNSDVVYVLTAAHVAGTTLQDDARVKFAGRSASVVCKLIAAGRMENTDEDPDLALLKCPRPDGLRLEFAVSGKHVPTGAPLILSKNGGLLTEGCANPPQLSTPITVPAYLPLKEAAGRLVTFWNPLPVNIQGASGGPVMTERSEVIGVVRNYGEQVGSSDAISWTKAEDWLEKSWPEWKGMRHRVGTVAHSAALLHRTNVELSAGVSAVQVPGFGMLPVAPRLRIATSLASRPTFGFAFDFTSSQSTIGDVSLSFNTASATTEFRVGSVVSALRRRDLLGGIYVAGGVTSSGLEKTLSGSEPVPNRAWGAVVDAGWRYQIRERSWGVIASYREGFLFGRLAGQNYSRFRSPSVGMFLVLR